MVFCVISGSFIQDWPIHCYIAKNISCGRNSFQKKIRSHSNSMQSVEKSWKSHGVLNYATV